MSINKEIIKIMNELLEKGKTIADIAKTYPQFEYSEIYLQVNDSSALGKKRKITNRLKNIVLANTTEQRENLAAEAQQLLDELYKQFKINSNKLVEIDQIMRRKS